MNTPRYLMHSDGVRLVSSRNQRTGDETEYPFVAARRPRKAIRIIRRICLAVFAVISIGLMGVGAVKGLGL